MDMIIEPDKVSLKMQTIILISVAGLGKFSDFVNRSASAGLSG